MSEHVNNTVKDFYDKVSEKLDFRCEINNPRLSQRVRDIINGVHPDILKRNYGSAFIIPDQIEGCKIFDMGCGAGVMAFVLSKLVGQDGFITGVDISPNLISEANKAMEYHRVKYGYERPNTEFKVMNVENFTEVQKYENKLDLVLSYGVICLCNSQRTVFENIYKMLKYGGELSYSDVHADRDRPKEVLQNQRLLSLGTACAMRWDEMIEMVTSIGFTKPYLFGAAPVEFEDKELHKATGYAEFARGEWRLFKLPKGLKKSAAEVTYNGNIKDQEESYRWDVNTVFPKGKPVIVDAALAAVLQNTRFKNSFSFKECTLQEQVVTNPFQMIEEMKKKGQAIKPAYKI